MEGFEGRQLGHLLPVTGNTTMMHLLCGLPGEHIGKAPFIPATLEPMRLPAADLGIASQAPAFLLPGISAYIGADIVAEGARSLAQTSQCRASLRTPRGQSLSTSTRQPSSGAGAS